MSTEKRGRRKGNSLASHRGVSRMQVLPRLLKSRFLEPSYQYSPRGLLSDKHTCLKRLSGIFPCRRWERCRKGQAGRRLFLWRNTVGCVWGMGVPEWGNRKAFQGPVYVLLRDTECTWASFPKEYRCLAWPQLDCPATLSLAVFTSRHLKTFSSSSA